MEILEQRGSSSFLFFMLFYEWGFKNMVIYKYSYLSIASHRGVFSKVL